jgi:predicted extracellular nuclease
MTLLHSVSAVTAVPVLACALALGGCSSSSSATAAGDSGTPHDSGPATDTGTTGDAGATKDGGSTGDSAAPTPTTTIAAARTGNVSTPITVKAFVTALAGVPGDYPTWYIEDPAGGPSSGVAVYCDPLAGTPCNVPEPALHDLIVVTGKLSTYKGQVQLEPTAMTKVQSNATPPPVATVTAADVAPGGNSTYRGVYVKLTIPSKLVVDSVTPTALFDTACGATAPSADGGAADAGPAKCTNLCTPPAFSGFQANDGTGNEVYIEAPFFNTDPLQSSPECLTQTGVVPVTVGTTFTQMSGILDYDGYASAQGLSPVQPSDYTTP